MSAHTPYVVVKIGGPINPTGILYKVTDGEDPVYERVAEGFLSPVLDMAKQLNYLDAERNNKLAVAEVDKEDPEKTVGIPAGPQEAVLAVRKALREWDSGRLSQGGFASRIRRAVFPEEVAGES